MKNTLNHKHAQRRAKRMFALLTCLMLALAMQEADTPIHESPAT